MILLYIYCFLGITSLSDINYYIKKDKSELKVLEYNNIIIDRLYSLIILILLILNIIYNVIEKGEIYKNIFVLHYLIHFIILKIKFNKLIIYKIYENKNFYNISLLCQLIIIILAIIYVIIYNINIKEVNIKSIISNIIDVIGLCIYYNSVLIFILLFTKLLQEIYVLNIKINEIIENRTKGLIECYYNIIELKYKSSKYIGNFNYIFNFFTLINILILLVIINNIEKEEKKNINMYYYIISQFVIIEIIILIIISYIRKIRQDLLNQIYNSIVIEKLVKNYDINSFNDKYNIELDIENINKLTIYSIINNNSNSINWLILYNTLNSKWMELDLCGIEIQSFNSISKVLFVSSIIYKLYN